MRTLLALCLPLFVACSSAPNPPAPADVAAPPEGAIRTPSGLAYVVLKKGEGTRRPVASDQVSVHYVGWKTDGSFVDSSFQYGRPAVFGVSGVIKGWTEALQLMVVGDELRVWIPANLAYEGMPSRPQGMLVFDVELLGIQ